MKKEIFGTLPTGENVEIFTLENASASVKIMTRGATVCSFNAFGTEIVGHFDSLEDYLADGSHQGGLIGRVANRVAGAAFVMDGKTFRLPKNDGENCLHGGDGFDHKLFTVKEAGDDFLTLYYVSPDGEEGFPAKLEVSVTYRLRGGDLLIDYTAVPDGKTPIALTNHSYFNLDGFGGDILSHRATIYAQTYTQVNDALIPDGVHPKVEGTAFDFRTPHAIGERVGGDFIGYDHNFVLTPTKTEEKFGYVLPLAATVENGKLQMNVFTDQPGIQFYIGNFLNGETDFAGGIQQRVHGAFCLEAQTEPDCIHHGIGFYDKGSVYRQTTVYSVSKL